MSDPSELAVYVQFKDDVLRRQLAEFENLMGKGRGSIRGESPLARGGREMEAMTKKQTNIFDRIKGGIGDIGKNTLSLIGIGVGVGAIVALLTEASPLLKSGFKLIQTGIMFMIRPIADFIGMLLRPIAITFLTQVATPFYRHVMPFMRILGDEGAKNIANFFRDPRESLHNLWVSILNWDGWVDAQRAYAETPKGGGGGATGQTDIVNEFNLIWENLAEGADLSEGSKEQMENIKRAMEIMRKRASESQQFSVDIKDSFSIMDQLSGLSTNSMKQTEAEFVSIVGLSTAIGVSLGLTAEEIAKVSQSVKGGAGGIIAIWAAIQEAARDVGLIPKTAQASRGGITVEAVRRAGFGGTTIERSAAAGRLGGVFKGGARILQRGGTLHENVFGFGEETGTPHLLHKGEEVNNPHIAGGRLSGDRVVIQMPLSFTFIGNQNSREILDKLKPELERMIRDISSKYGLSQQSRIGVT